VLVAFLFSTTALADEAADRHFSERTWPLLLARCVSCHGPETQEGELRLDSRAAALKGGKHGPAVREGKPQESLLLRTVRHEVEKLEMPPKEKLSAADIAALERWIRNGVPWPEIRPAGSQATAKGDRIGDAWHDARNPIVRIFRGERLNLWSLKPIVSTTPPAVEQAEWLRTPIDAFVLARLESEKLVPSPEADRRTLARRLYFDLVGLPPTPAEMERFLADARPDAYERLVEELLASPRYGEHAARMWLDVVRYSDSNGFDWDEFRPRAWLYRDYVVRSMSADKPYDQFLREQLAGDELMAGAPRTPAEQDALIATGYLRMGPQDNAAGLFNEQDRSRAEWMADLVETTGSAFLGLTFSCCRCHDHKFDPLSQADHFRMRAFFEPLKYGDDLSLDLAPEQEAIAAHNAALDAQAAEHEKGREKLRAAAKEQLREQNKDKEPTDEEAAKAFSAEEQEKDKKLKAAIDELKKQRRKPSTGLLARDSAGDVPVTKILYQGDHKSPRDPVEPGFISALDPNAAVIVPAPNKSSKGRRLALANWTCSPDNPLAARVLVNRVWQSHFGRGLVATPNDFGLAGSRPSHPELLDWLASEFVRSGWSIKDLHRQIVLSATYRQSSMGSALLGERDADNVLLARQNTRRLSAEQLRDALLAISGLLNAKAGGPPVWPELPAEVLQANPAFLDDNETKTKGWYPSPAREQDARSVFLVQKRTVRIPFMELFDLPENSTSCARRNTSTVAPQAFSLLNSPLAVRAAQAFADRVKNDAGENAPAQVKLAFVRALQREPASDELAASEALINSRGLVALCRVLLNLNEFVYRD
jgi:mono/diheme cytochrome c family protein